ncbi:MAG: hypothetical protein IPH13_07435 [Planctomycetes bacterium]|nr:hypothetical protein [Planctomycetota bacterium]
MIATLRCAHRWIWGVLSLAVPALVVAAWSVRPRAELDGRGGSSSRFDRIDGEDGRIVALEGTALTFVPARAHGSIRQDGTVAVVLREQAPLALAYWSKTPADGSSLPNDAVLLGPVDSERVAELKPPTGAGTLVIYSLGHHTVLTRASWPLDEARGG